MICLDEGLLVELLEIYLEFFVGSLLEDVLAVYVDYCEKGFLNYLKISLVF